MVVYMGMEYLDAIEILSSEWKSRPKFLYRDLDHAIRKAKRETKNEGIATVLELTYLDPRRLSYNPHKYGYHTCKAPTKIRVKWIAVNGGTMQFNYPTEKRGLHDLRSLERDYCRRR